MLDRCEELFVCDMAQYYGVLDYTTLPMRTCATLAKGLPADSRTFRKLSNTRLSLTDALLARVLDSLNILIWQNTKDGHRGRKKPKSVYEALTNPPKKDTYITFDTEEEVLDFLRKAQTDG